MFEHCCFETCGYFARTLQIAQLVQGHSVPVNELGVMLVLLFDFKSCPMDSSSIWVRQHQDPKQMHSAVVITFAGLILVAKK